VAVGAAVARTGGPRRRGPETPCRHYLSVDVPTFDVLNITLQMWSYDSSGHNQHSNIRCPGLRDGRGRLVAMIGTVRDVPYYLQAPIPSTWYNFSGHDGGSLQAFHSPSSSRRSCRTGSHVPHRAGRLFGITTSPIPKEHPRGATRQPRFVALLLNVTSIAGTDRRRSLSRVVFFSLSIYHI